MSPGGRRGRGPGDRSLSSQEGTRLAGGCSSGPAPAPRGPLRREPGALRRRPHGQHCVSPVSSPPPLDRALTAKEGAKGEAFLLVPLKETPERPEHPASLARPGPAAPRVPAAAEGAEATATPPAVPRKQRPGPAWRRRGRRPCWPGWTRRSTWSVRAGAPSIPGGNLGEPRGLSAAGRGGGMGPAEAPPAAVILSCASRESVCLCVCPAG